MPGKLCDGANDSDNTFHLTHHVRLELQYIAESKQRLLRQIYLSASRMLMLNVLCYCEQRSCSVACELTQVLRPLHAPLLHICKHQLTVEQCWSMYARALVTCSQALTLDCSISAQSTARRPRPEQTNTNAASSMGTVRIELQWIILTATL